MNGRIKLDKPRQPNKFICSDCGKIAKYTGKVIDTCCLGCEDEGFGCYEYKCACVGKSSKNVWRDSMAIDFEFILSLQKKMYGVDERIEKNVRTYREGDKYYQELIK